MNEICNSLLAEHTRWAAAFMTTHVLQLPGPTVACARVSLQFCSTCSKLKSAPIGEPGNTTFVS
eukprot:2799104-Amphidinium_carterae.1